MRKIRWKRVTSFLLAAVTTVSSFLGVGGMKAFAAGNIGKITFEQSYDGNGNLIKYNAGAYINGHHAGGIGKNRTRMFVDGETAFCIQPGVSLHTGDTLKRASSAAWNELSINQKKAVILVLLYGYQANRNHLPGSDDEQWIATQTILWEFVTGNRKVTGSFTKVSNQIANLAFGDTYPNPGIKNVYDQIVSLLKKHNQRPSFLVTDADAPSKKLMYQDGKYSLVLTDENGVLSDYSVSSGDARVKVSQTGNQLTVTADDAFNGKIRITASRNNIPTVSRSAKLIAYGDSRLQDVVTGVENTEPVYGYLNVETPTASLDLKKVSEDGIVSGIHFTIHGEGMTKTVVTDETGHLSVEGLRPGTYTITEQNIDRYVPQQSQTITLIGGQTGTVSFHNNLKRGSLEVVKTSEDHLVEGMKFHLYGTSLSGEKVDAYAVTDKAGVAKFENILISGNTPYMLEEVETPVRYVVPAGQNAAIEWNKVTHKSFDNRLKKFKVTVTKKDSEKGTAQGDATVFGATYGMYKGNTLVDQYVTDEKGTFTTKEYVCADDWTIREIKPSEGYLLDTTTHEVGASPKLYTVEHNATSNNVKEQVIKGNLAIIKHTDDGSTKIETPEKGAAFEVYLKAAGSYEAANADEKDVLVCDENGFAQSKNLPYGTYTVHQTKGWEGRELMDDFDVFISKDQQTYRYLINNRNFESFVRIVKVDAETGKTIPYAGAGFQLFDPSGNPITMTYTYPTPTTMDTFYTDGAGMLVTPEKLSYGKGYSLVEVQAPYGYVLDQTPQKFDLTEDASTDEQNLTIVKVEKPNVAQKGKILIEKTGEVFADVKKSGGEKTLEIYQPVYAVKGLEGAVYEVRAAKDVVTPDGTLRYKKGEVVDILTTKADGKASGKELYLGEYTIKEIKAPAGMVRNDADRTVTLSYAGQEVSVTETAASFYNERQKAEIQLKKAWETDETYHLGSREEWKHICFGLYAADELKAASGAVIPKDGLMEIVAIDQNGVGKIQSDLPFGTYYVKETATDEHYQLSEETYPITFAYAGQEIGKVELAINEGNPLENKLIYGAVRGKKVDENGKSLKGAMFGIFSANETEFTEEKALTVAESDENGSFAFKNVPYGMWQIKELRAPKGYVADEKIYEVEIGRKEQVIEIEVSNKQIRGNLKLTKIDADYPENKLTGAVFEVYEDKNGDGKLEEQDQLLGTLKETETGIYTMNDLVFGKYLVKETKAPDGFRLDKGVYSVSIEENGKTYDVENEAGVGFLNEAMKGSLKIRKTSTDNRVEGFSFRVVGDHGFEQVYRTNSKGEILIENLRIGKYTVFEVEDATSKPYILAANQEVTVRVDETVEITMHNVLRDTPKTGDDRNPTLWLVLAGVAAVGTTVSYLVYRHKKKKK